MAAAVEYTTDIAQVATQLVLDHSVPLAEDQEPTIIKITPEDKAD
jgi:hypothetical protein